MLRKLFALLAVSSAGCFGGSFLNRNTDGIVRMQAPSQEVDFEVARAQAVRPQLTFPCRVAVHFQQSSSQWRWTSADKARFDDLAKSLKEAGIASDVFAVSQLTLPENERAIDVSKLRVAAAKHGADVLCVIQGNSDVKTERNPASVLYLTVVGGFFVPGTNCDARFTVVGSVVDVRNGFLYAAVEEEEDVTLVRPTFLLEESTAVEKAKKKAYDRFYPTWKKRLLSLKDAFAGHGLPPVTPPPSPVTPAGATGSAQFRPSVSPAVWKVGVGQ